MMNIFNNKMMLIYNRPLYVNHTGVCIHYVTIYFEKKILYFIIVYSILINVIIIIYLNDLMILIIYLYLYFLAIYCTKI